MAAMDRPDRLDEGHADGVGALGSSHPGPRGSPSQHMLHELGIHSIVHNRSLYDKLDQAQSDREAQHRRALAMAAQIHQQVRDDAQRAAQLRVLYDQEQRAVREHEEKSALLRLQARAEEDAQMRQLQEEILRKEQEERLRRIDEERVRVQEQRKRIEQERAQQATPKPPAPAPAQPAAAAVAPATGATTAVTGAQPSQAKVLPKPLSEPSAGHAMPNLPAQSVEETVHADYLAIHQRLKAFRKYVKDNRKTFPFPFTDLSEIRRKIQQTVGQFIIGAQARESNRTATNRLKQQFESARRFANPTVDVRQFTRGPHPAGLSEADFQAPLAFVYAINFFAKKAVDYFANTCSSQTDLAEPVGVAVVSLFGGPTLQWNGISLFDVMLAKFHVSCPLVFGISGDPSTEGGRRRLGWRRQDDPNGGEQKMWATEKQHHESMTGLGAGFASLALRDFSKSKTLTNPFPHDNFWRAVAYIVNTPPAKAHQTHFIVLKGLLQHCLPRFIEFYGHAAIVALRQAIIYFPAAQPSSNAAIQGVETLKGTFKREMNLDLTP